VTSVLRVELFFDEEAGNWHYRVPALHINGGGTPTREDAERDALSAIAFALEGRRNPTWRQQRDPHLSSINSLRQKRTFIPRPALHKHSGLARRTGP
jgi:hypothetical protein